MGELSNLHKREMRMVVVGREEAYGGFYRC